jgi:hypothetical protein
MRESKSFQQPPIFAPAPQVAQRLTQAAFVDPNDPTVIYVQQPAAGNDFAHMNGRSDAYAQSFQANVQPPAYSSLQQPRAGGIQ